MKPVDVRNASILIVVGEEADAEALEKMLREDGYSRITTTQNAHRVLELHRQNNFDLILLDLELRGMDGFQVITALKTNIKDPYLSVIIMTAHPELKLRALQAGAKDFIFKPFDSVEVQTRISNILQVRLLYMELEKHARMLEQRVQDRTAELQQSEARFRGLTELAADWYWEQDRQGNFTKVSGPVPEILGIHRNSAVTSANDELEVGWNTEQRSVLQAMITARESFLDFEFSRKKADGTKHTYLVSGQPMFDQALKFLGYRGIGVEINLKTKVD